MPILVMIIFIIVIAASAKSKENEARKRAMRNGNGPVNQGITKPVMNGAKPPVQPMNRPPVQPQTYMNRPPMQTQRPVQPQNCNEPARCGEPQRVSTLSSYSHRSYNDEMHPRLGQGQGIIGFRHESWIPVPRGYRVKKCEYCGAANSISMMGGEYKCYFCWKRL